MYRNTYVWLLLEPRFELPSASIILDDLSLHGRTRKAIELCKVLSCAMQTWKQTHAVQHVPPAVVVLRKAVPPIGSNSAHAQADKNRLQRD